MLACAACVGSIVDGTHAGDDVDAGDQAAAVARAKFDRDVLPSITRLCGPCHAGTVNAWMASAPDPYTAILAWPRLVDTAAPAASMMLSKGNHEGPALGADDQAVIIDWLRLEVIARAGQRHNPEIDAVDLVTGPNTLALDALGAVGSTITFTAQKLTQGVYLSRIAVTAGTGGIRLTHPLFVLWDGTTPRPDPVDSFDAVDLELAAGATASLGGGLLMLENAAGATRLSVAFQKVGPAGGGATPPPVGCKAVAAFTASARMPLSQNCVSCHGGANPAASNATDMTRMNDTGAAGQTAACGQILGRVDLVNPAASGILVAPDPASGATHPFKFPSAAAFTAFRTGLTTWITAENAAP